MKQESTADTSVTANNASYFVERCPSEHALVYEVVVKNPKSFLNK